jgi:hypothetical protein
MMTAMLAVKAGEQLQELQELLVAQLAAVRVVLAVVPLARAEQPRMVEVLGLHQQNSVVQQRG